MSRRLVLRRVGIGIASLSALGGAVAAGHSIGKQSPPRLQAGPAGAPLRIDNVIVVDPRDGSRRVDASIRVRDGAITSVSASDGGEGLEADEWAIDGEGRFAVPGYINMHTHVLQAAERRELYLATMLAEGTTGMRQMAGSDESLDARAQSRLELTDYAPGLLAMPGALLMPFNADSGSGVERLIADQKRRGADFIKLVDVDREVFFAAVNAAHRNGLRIAGHLPALVTPEEAAEAGIDCIEHLGTGANVWFQTSADGAALRAEADNTGAQRIPGSIDGLPLAEHFSTDFVQPSTKKMLLNPVLLDSPETVSLLRRALDSFDEDAARNLVDVFARQKTWHTPTLTRMRSQYRADDPAYADHPWLSMVAEEDRRDFHETRNQFLALPAETKATYHDCYDLSLRLVGMMHAAGVPIMAGTDGPTASPGLDMASEFRELAAAGLGPLDVLRSATTVPAAYLDRTHELGAIDVGMNADFLLLDGDPLSSVENLTRIAAVVRAGHFIARDEMQSVVDRLAG